MPEEPRRKRLPRAVREQQMLDAAVRVFSRQGFHAASMDEIAEFAGVSKPMLYLYLGSKDDLFSACIDREADRLLDTLGAAVQGRSDDPAEQLFHGLTAFFGYVSANRDSWAVLYQQARSHSDSFAEQLARARREIVETVTELVRRSMARRGAAPGYAALRKEASAVAHALVGAADALADWTLLGTREAPEETARRLMNLVWIGLERRRAGDSYQLPAPGVTAP
ncbi:TetR/AcrR family transcriptional regulator [Streptomyces capparidis]